MKRIKKLLFLLIIFIIFIYLVVSLSSKSRNNNLKNYLYIDIYYETRCPDSSNFVLKIGNLKPKFLKNLLINFVPFGKASVGPTKFIFCLQNIFLF